MTYQRNKSPYTIDLDWTCPCCGRQYDTLSFAYALDEPDAWRAIPEAERRYRGVLGTDTCTIDGGQFFIRGRVVIPVIGYDEPFRWGIWASVSKESFERYGRLWDVAVREHEAPISGVLASDVPIYPATSNLRCSIHLRNARKRPSFAIEPADHPLAAEQRNGITLDRVKEIAAVVQRHRG
jgi:hypothetical protein